MIRGMEGVGEELVRLWRAGADRFPAHTSGSTGTPKDVLLPRRDVTASARATNERFGITSQSLLVSPLSADYIAGKMMIVRALLADCDLVMELPSNQPLHEDYGEIQLLPIVPSQAQHLIDHPGKLANVKSVIIGGSAIPADMEQKIAAWPTNAYAAYGMTETCSHVALRRIGQETYKAMPGITFSTDSDGRLSIQAPAYSFGTLQTNDVVELVSPRMFRYLGRADNVINSGGIKIHPEELESILSQRIKEPFYLTSEPHPLWGEALVLVIARAGRPRSLLDCDLIAEIHSICDELLPSKLRPKRVIVRAELPHTTSGKIIRERGW